MTHLRYLQQEWQKQSAKGQTVLSFNDWLQKWILIAYGD